MTRVPPCRWFRMGIPWAMRTFVADGGGGVFRHETVLRDEALRWLAPAAGKLFIDLTLGGGGHSEGLLEAGAEVVGFDRDPAALAAATARLARFGGRFRAVASNFARFGTKAAELDLPPADGILMDLGVSSPQLDEAERGFSFLRDGALDMRMGADTGTTAADLVNGLPEAELAALFREYGEEPQARRAARAVVARRSRGRIATTVELASCLEEALGRHGGHHPATRVFLALRLAVNRELESLGEALAQVAAWLRPGGRLVVITFHSLEDRVVKRFIREHSAPEIDRPEWPSPRPNPACHFRDLTRHPVVPADEETRRNPRARSAKLRAAERRQP